MTISSVVDITPAEWQRSISNEEDELNCYNVKDGVVMLEQLTAAHDDDDEDDDLTNDHEESSQHWKRSSRSIIPAAAREALLWKEKRNPLLERVKNTKLSCFKSSTNIGGVSLQNHQQPDVAGTRTPHHPHTHTLTHDSKGKDYGQATSRSHAHIGCADDDDCQRLIDSVGDIDECSITSLPSPHPHSHSNSPPSSSMGCAMSGAHPSSIDLVGQDHERQMLISDERISSRDAELRPSVLNENVAYAQVYERLRMERESCSSSKGILRGDVGVATGSSGSSPPHSKAEINFNSSSCLSAKIRAMSEKYLKNSTNKLLAKLYRSNNSCKSTEAQKKSGGGKAKLRSFSYGALPGLNDFQKRHNPLYHEEDDDQLAGFVVVNGGGNGEPPSMTTARDFGEDSDSGILVNGGSSNSSVVEVCGGSSNWSPPRVGSPHHRSLSNRKPDSLACDAVFEKSEFPPPPPSTSSNGAGSGKFNSSQRLYKSAANCNHARSLSNDAYDPCSKTARNRYSTSSISTSPPVPPPRHDFDAPSTDKRDFRFVKLLRNEPGEEMGIFIAKINSSRGNGGYAIAHVVPGGLVQRLVLLLRSLNVIHSKMIIPFNLIHNVTNHCSKCRSYPTVTVLQMSIR